MRLELYVENAPEYAEEHEYIVARLCGGKAWFFGAYDSKSRAEAVADEIDGVVLENKL